MLYTNLKHYLKHLLYGIYKMHKNRIVNRDIKPENIMAKYNKESNNINIRFIDFGLSEELTNEYCTHYSNILANGTRDYIPLDICIIYNIIYHDDSLDKKYCPVEKREADSCVTIGSKAAIDENSCVGLWICCFCVGVRRI